jgi:APA family basic amino acid/polyamine antiporter
LNKAIIIAILAGYASVILVMLMGQSRVFFSMSRDGLIPSVFSEVHPTYRTPAKNNMMFMLFVSLFAAFVPARVVGEMTSIGTLFAFILVCIGIIVLRRTMPDAPRSFKTPLVPLVPILGIATCLFMMVFLPLDTWIRLIVWMMIGIDIFAAYGFKKSVYTEHQRSIKEKRIIGYSGLLLALALFVVASFHHLHSAGNDSVLFYFSVIFASVHVVYYAWKFVFIGMPQK